MDELWALSPEQKRQRLLTALLEEVGSITAEGIQRLPGRMRRAAEMAERVDAEITAADLLMGRA